MHVKTRHGNYRWFLGICLMISLRLPHQCCFFSVHKDVWYLQNSSFNVEFLLNTELFTVNPYFHTIIVHTPCHTVQCTFFVVHACRKDLKISFVTTYLHIFFPFSHHLVVVYSTRASRSPTSAIFFLLVAIFFPQNQDTAWYPQRETQRFPH